MSIRRPRLLDGDPPELLVYDETTECPYLQAKTARLPMRLPTRPLNREEFAARLGDGDRRQGLVLYRPACPECNACQAIRIEVDQFQPSRSQKRVWRKGNTQIQLEIGTPTLTDDRVRLYNAHKRGRDLMGEGEPIDAAGYGAFLVDTCTDSFEMRYRVRGELAGLAVVDRAEDALSAVYTYFDPDYSQLSPGTFSILKQIELCQRWGLRWLYLGLYVEGCESMTYKSRFHPHERMLDGQWIRSDDG